MTITSFLNVNSALFICFVWISLWGVWWGRKGWTNLVVKTMFLFLGLYVLLVWLYNMGYIISIK